LLAGCGHGVVHTLPVSRADLPPGEPLIQTLPIHEAYYHVEPDGQVTVALRYRHRSLLGPALSAEWIMSIVVDKLPAGRERLYSLTTREVRMAQTRGLDRRRGRAVSGVLVLGAPRGGRMRGRFHAAVPQQVFTALGGWSPAHRGSIMTTTGAFEALENPAKARAIRARTEADGFDRPPRITTAPAAEK
jgi:hypothetical protein